MHSIRSIFIYLISFIVFFLIGPILLLVILIYPQATYSAVVPFCRLMIVMFRCQFKIKGEFPTNERFVIMANHSSFLDVFAVPLALKGKFSAIAAEENFKIPIYATFLKKLKVVSINRSNQQQAIKGIRNAEQVLKSGYHIVILPEGTRTIDGKLGQFKKGGFHLAKNTTSRILPIAVNGLFNIKPKNRWTIQPGLIEITICQPIETRDKSVDETILEVQNIFLNQLNC